MIVIRQSDFSVIQALGGYQSKIKGKKYRFNKYLMTYQYDDETLLMSNVFTAAFVSMKTYEYGAIFSEHFYDFSDFLLKNYFIVPEEYDEYTIQEEVLKKVSRTIGANYLDKPSSFTIFTTTKCNARCKYCYEMSLKKKQNMSIETAEKVARYIIDQHNANEIVNLDWFGGEPLYNKEVIDIICSRVASSGVKYQSNMISNGYLMNDEMIKKAKTLWNLQMVQITLDGVGEKYNKTKKFIYKDDPNPFETVMSNIYKLIDNKIAVSIRMNCDNSNAEDLKELAKYLVEKFGNLDIQNKRIYFAAYVHQIFDEENKRSEEETKELCDNLLEIQQILIDGKIQSSDIMGSRTIHCLVDSEKGVTIMPNGDLGLCEHYIDKHTIGHIDSLDKLDIEAIREWKTYIKDDPMCLDCVLKPYCLKIVRCPDSQYCTDTWKDYKIKTAFNAMVNCYQRYIEELEDTEQKPADQCNSCKCCIQDAR